MCIYMHTHCFNIFSTYLASLMDASNWSSHWFSEAWTTFTKAAFSERCWACWPRVQWIPLWWEVKAGDGPKWMDVILCITYIYIYIVYRYVWLFQKV